MKNINVIIAGLFIIMGFVLFSSGYAQTGTYSCNVIYAEQENHPMSNILVDLYDSNNQLLATTFTDDNGYFTFENLNVNENYVAKFSYDGEVTSVDLEDAYGVLQYLFGMRELSPLEKLAANVDGNSQINWNDFWYILLNYYVNDLDFPIGNWILPDWSFTMTDNKATGGPASVTSTGDIVGGDLPDKSSVKNSMVYQEILEFENQELVVPIYLNDVIGTNGIGLVLGFNNELIEITQIETSIEGLQYNVKDGMIRMGWTDLENTYIFSPHEPLVKIHIKEKGNLSQGQIENFELMEGTHILDKSGRKYPYVDFISSEFKLSSPSNNTETIEYAYPNPCKKYFTVQMDSDETSMASIQIYNSLGQLVSSQNQSIQNEKLIINTQNIKNGLYFYQIKSQLKLMKGYINISN